MAREALSKKVIREPGPESIERNHSNEQNKILGPAEASDSKRPPVYLLCRVERLTLKSYLQPGLQNRWSWRVPVSPDPPPHRLWAYARPKRGSERVGARGGQEAWTGRGPRAVAGTRGQKEEGTRQTASSADENMEQLEPSRASGGKAVIQPFRETVWQYLAK